MQTKHEESQIEGHVVRDDVVSLPGLLRRIRIARPSMPRGPAVKGIAITLACLALASVIFWFAVTIVNSLTDLKHELTAARRDIVAARERVARIERRLEDPEVAKAAEVKTRAGPFFAPSPSSSPLAPAATPAPLQLGAQAVQVLRDYIKMPPAPPGVKPTLAVGAPVPDALLLPIPQQISDKAPELNGMRFTTDKDGSIVIVRRGSRRVDAIVPPS